MNKTNTIVEDPKLIKYNYYYIYIALTRSLTYKLIILEYIILMLSLNLIYFSMFLLIYLKLYNKNDAIFAVIKKVHQNIMIHKGTEI